MKQVFPWILVGVLLAGLAWALFLRSPEVVTNTVEVERIRVIDRIIGQNEARSSNLSLQDLPLGVRQTSLEHELTRLLSGMPASLVFLDYTNTRNDRDRGYVERLDLGRDTIALLRERGSSYSNLAAAAGKAARKKDFIIAGLVVTDLVMMAIAAKALFSMK
jgi:hypothetical protein